jgi:two-component system CheB/CheR fusion protein
MPEQLIAYAKHPYVSKSDRSRSILEDESGLTRIFSLLRERFKIDFTYYKPSTVTRRIERRMTVNQIFDINDYALYAQNTPAEIATLYRELLIGVTNFFRDSDAYQDLMDKWLPELMEDADQHELRFWTAGCSTGEEAYSIAITARECMERLGITKDIKIFATDIDRDAVAKAGAGIYPESIAADISPQLLSKYFYRKDENFHIVRNIREMVVFAQHNLIEDPPFTQIDLVTCRNLLIYLQPVLQKKVLSLINFSLRPGAILMLGLSETIGEMTDLYESVNSKYKIYRSKGKANPTFNDSGMMIVDRKDPLVLRPKMLGGVRMHRITEDERILQRFVDALSEDYIPLSIVINKDLEVRHIIGDTAGLLQLPSGRPVNDISKMVPSDIAIPLSTGVQKVYRTRKTQSFSNIQVSRNDHIQSLRMTLRPLPEKRGQEPLVAILIEEISEKKTRSNGQEVRDYDVSSETEQYVHDMEQELQFTKENLQATIEELETANEELQATNEELLASNEELQSTNEELQSTNEELHTVNLEYQNKIIELTELNNDIENILFSTQSGKLLLDDNLEIRRFSSYIKKFFKILESDIGRPLTHLTHRLVGENPVEHVRNVMTSKQNIEKDVLAEDGHWYSMRISPYQIGPGIYSGTVLSFIDITDLKRSCDALDENKEIYKDAQTIAKLGIWELDIENDKMIWSEEIYDLLEQNPNKNTASYKNFLKMVHPDDRSHFEKNYGLSIKSKNPLRILHRFMLEDGQIKYVKEICRTLYDLNDNPIRTIGTVLDISSLKLLENDLMVSESNYKSLFDTIRSGVAVFKAIEQGADFVFTDFNKAAENINRVKKDSLIGKKVSDVFPEVKASGLLGAMKRVWETGYPEQHFTTLSQHEQGVDTHKTKLYKLPTHEVVVIHDEISQ